MINSYLHNPLDRLRTRDSRPLRSRPHSSCKQGGSRHEEQWGKQVLVGHEHTAFIPAKPSPSPDESSMSPLDKRREELEHGAGGDHDLPYRFTLPTSLPQVFAWALRLSRVRQGDFQPEVGAFDERQPQHPGGSCIPTYAP